MEWFTCADAAERAGVDPLWLEQACAGGWVPSVFVRGEHLVSELVVEDLVG